MTERTPGPGRQHPEEWRGDLSDDPPAGRNTGPSPRQGERRTAYDMKDVHERLRGLPDDDLKRIPILPEGERLQQGATYLDLTDADRAEFTATAEMIAEPDHRYVAKDEVDYVLWNRLTG